jgi:hypothetical protein
MAEPEASHTRAGTDRDDAPFPELPGPEPPEPPGSWPATSSFPRRSRRRHPAGHSAHDSSSSLADDEKSLGGLNEANGELCHPLCPVQQLSARKLEAPHVVAHPSPAKQRISQSSDSENHSLL